MGYNGLGPAAGGAAAGVVAGGALAVSGMDAAMWTVLGVACLLVGLVMIRLSMLYRTKDD